MYKLNYFVVTADADVVEFIKIAPVKAERLLKTQTFARKYKCCESLLNVMINNFLCFR